MLMTICRLVQHEVMARMQGLSNFSEPVGRIFNAGRCQGYHCTHCAAQVTEADSDLTSPRTGRPMIDVRCMDAPVDHPEIHLPSASKIDSAK